MAKRLSMHWEHVPQCVWWLVISQVWVQVVDTAIMSWHPALVITSMTSALVFQM